MELLKGGEHQWEGRGWICHGGCVDGYGLHSKSLAGVGR